MELYGLDQALLYTRHEDGQQAAQAADARHDGRERSKGSKKSKGGKRRRAGGR